MWIWDNTYAWDLQSKIVSQLSYESKDNAEITEANEVYEDKFLNVRWSVLDMVAEL